MKKTWIAIFLALMLAGCKVQQEIKLDTIVDIPLNPTEEATETLTEAQPTTDTVPDETIPQETDSPTEATQAAEKTTSSKTSTGGSSTKTTTKKSGSTTKATGSTKATVPSTAPTEAPTAPPTEPPTQAPTELPTEPAEYDATGYKPISLDYAVIDAINAQRGQAGLEPLSTDPKLCAIASARAYEVSFSWSHTRPDGSGFTTILTQYGFGFSTAAESIHNTYAVPSADTIVTKWMGSDANRVNLLSENAVKIGVGTYTAADGAVYTAALFVG